LTTSFFLMRGSRPMGGTLHMASHHAGCAHTRGRRHTRWRATSHAALAARSRAVTRMAYFLPCTTRRRGSGPARTSGRAS
jgi:hypothetical protein